MTRWSPLPYWQSLYLCAREKRSTGEVTIVSALLAGANYGQNYGDSTCANYGDST